MIQEEEKKPIPVEENKENDNLEADEKKYYKEQHKLNTWVAVGKNKRYFLIDQQLARHFVHYSEWSLTQPLPFYATQIITLFLLHESQQITKKGWDF